MPADHPTPHPLPSGDGEPGPCELGPGETEPAETKPAETRGGTCSPDHDRPRYRVGEWWVTPSLGLLRRRGRTVELTVQQMRLLELLIEHGNRVVDRATLIDGIWPDTAVEENALNRCVSEVRRAVGDDARRPRFLETLPKRGYRLVPGVRKIEPDPLEAPLAPEPVTDAVADPLSLSIPAPTASPDPASADSASTHSAGPDAASTHTTAPHSFRPQPGRLLWIGTALLLLALLLTLASGRRDREEEIIVIRTERSAALCPTDGDARQLAEAVRVLGQALDLERRPDGRPALHAVRLAFGRSLVEAGQWAEAELLLWPIVEADDSGTEQKALAYSLLARIRLGLDQPEAARTTLLRAAHLLAGAGRQRHAGQAPAPAERDPSLAVPRSLLAEAELAAAELTGAELTGAELTGAELTGAELTGASDALGDRALAGRGPAYDAEVDDQSGEFGAPTSSAAEPGSTRAAPLATDRLPMRGAVVLEP